MDPFTIIGLGLGAAGLAEKIFGESEAERRRKRIDSAVSRLSGMRTRALTEGGSLINQNTASSAASARQSAAARHLSLGGKGNAESFIVPAEGEVVGKGYSALRQYNVQTNQAYDRAIEQAELDYASGPIEASAGDYLFSAGTGLTQIGLNKEYTDSLGEGGIPEGTEIEGDFGESGLSTIDTATNELRDAARHGKRRKPSYEMRDAA